MATTAGSEREEVKILVSDLPVGPPSEGSPAPLTPPQPQHKAAQHGRQGQRPQQQQQETPGRLPQAASERSPFEKVQKHGREDSSDEDGTTELCAALNGLVNDIYAICVRYIVACYGERSQDLPKSFVKDKHKKITWLLCAALFTFLLQFALVILLWNAASIGNSPMVRPASDKLWQQVGVAHQLLCRWQQYNRLQHGDKHISLPNIKDCDCHKWWPDELPVEYKDATECLSKPLPANTSDEKCMGYMRRLNSSWTSYGRGLFFNKSTLMVASSDADGSKVPVALLMTANGTANCTANGTVSDNASGTVDCAANDTEPLYSIGEKLDPVTRIDPVFFIMFAFIQLAICVHQEFRQGVWLCYIAAGCVGVLPKFFGQLTRKEGSEWYIIDHANAEEKMPSVLKLMVLLVPMLQVVCSLAVLATGGVLFLFEQNQNDAVFIIVNSVALAFILDVDNRVGAIISQRAEWQYPETPVKPTHTAAMLKAQELRRLAQQVQTKTTTGADASAASTPSTPAFAPSPAAAAAATDVMCKTADGCSSPPTPTQPPTKAHTEAEHKRSFLHWHCPRWLKLSVGHLYVAIMGALIYAEVIFLAPQSVAQLLSFVVVVFTKVNAKVDVGAVSPKDRAGPGMAGLGMAPAFINNVERPPKDWFSDGLWFWWSFQGILDGYYGARNHIFSTLQLREPEHWIIMAFIFYGALTVLFVVLLCVRILPSCSRHYTYALVCTQLLLVGVAQVQDSTFQYQCNVAPLVNESITSDKQREKCPRNFWWLVVMGTYFCCWAFMFVYVPINMGFPAWILYICRKCCSFVYSCCSFIKYCICCKCWRSDQTPGGNEQASAPTSEAGIVRKCRSCIKCYYWFIECCCCCCCKWCVRDKTPADNEQGSAPTSMARGARPDCAPDNA